jgi:formylglycine-generating enzyme
MVAMMAHLVMGIAFPRACHAADTRFFRIISSTSTVITALSSDGILTWSNSDTGAACTVEAASSADIGSRWVRYTEVVSASHVTHLRIIDHNPPAGMVLIPAGSFAMGAATNVLGEGTINERPQHTVNISAFYMDQYEVTKALWDEVRTHNDGNGYGYTRHPGIGQGKATNHPVIYVTWYDVVKWCNARSERDGLTPVYYTDAQFNTVYKTGNVAPFVSWSANGYRLPTEAEWEKAARGGAAYRRFSWDDADTIQHARANYWATPENYAYDTSPTSGLHPAYNTGELPFTSPVGSFAPNGYGLFDMTGNMMEMCWDWYDQSYYAHSPENDPRGPDSPTGERVLRGGSYITQANMARVAFRSSGDPGMVSGYWGFRCVRSF